MSDLPPSRRDERESKLAEIESKFARSVASADVFSSVEWLLAEVRSLSKQLNEAKADIEKLSTPNIAGVGDDIGYEEESFESLAEIPNELRKIDWANRSIDGDWYAVLLVTKWDGEDIDEEEVRLFASRALAEAVIVESNLLRDSGIDQPASPRA